ncbi:ATP-dependent zinc metalloprotease [Lachnellula hyalina]|uniref:ATP-dependent zinc metalloprotease n=1 Tax=Lachnellula hyalina TaxID=1316788 RepID=A0A8H8R5Y0_9HELO|nr:ATP-dependent zinc metalloprotease [Lachnellula hyalina]TVY29058.1 ATP-dependent zinc metalloprotease [Lachnellula hyalina]
MAPGATENGGGEALVTALTATSKESNGTESIPEVGMECDIKNLYQKEDARGRTTWTDKYPDNLDEAAENEITARFAILVRNKKSFDSRKKLEIDSIVVQSPLLKTVLSKVLKDYPELEEPPNTNQGVTTTLKRLVFQAPFNPFVHRWTQFTTALEEQEEGETKSHLQLLHTTLEAELRDTIEAKNDFVKNKVITFGYLWTIFQPGATIYTNEWDRHCGSKFSQGSYHDHPKYGPVYGLNCQKVEWDGDKFGYANCQHVVTSFAGTMSISALDAIPLEFHPEQKKIRAQLLKRGKLFEHYHGYHYKSYKSFAIGKNMCGQDIKVTIDSRIIIDTHAYGKFNPNSIGHLQPLKMKSKADTPENSDEEYDEEYDEEEEETDDDYDQQIHYSTHNAAASRTDTKLIALSEEHLLHCSSLLKGYALKTKRWLSFFLDEISEIIWNNAAFSNLVLPADQKELILAFAESQVKYKDSFDDVISGKGKGIIMLLSGGPGIGKTLTAESVAENMQVPLYMMSAGDLGIKSSEVESSLTTILEMVAKWNAVLLLDECDVFLEARSAHDLERNKIVSIFLRTLEYYEGILFLTTNRVKNMDPAFQSRIHISMEYPGLDKSARVQVWRNFLERGVKHELSEGEIERLASVDINGRQIKNVLKTSQLLSQHKGVPLRYEHLRTVLYVERKELELS